jgi:hypothetical protein
MKPLNPWIDPRVSEVQPEQARAYLLAHGWEQKPFPRPEMVLFEGPPDDDGRPIRMFVPSERKGSDYLECIASLVTALAVIEDRGAATVLTDMLAAANGSPANGADRGRDAAVRATSQS